MSKRTVSSVKKSCDNLWSAIVRSFGRCEYCGTTETLSAHHVYGRRNHRLRFDVRNGCCLCYYCHITWAEQNAAGDKRPSPFLEWFENYRISDAKYLREENQKGTIHRIMDDYLELEKELKAELERQNAITDSLS